MGQGAFSGSGVHFTVVEEVHIITIQSEEYDLPLLKKADKKVWEERRCA